MRRTYLQVKMGARDCTLAALREMCKRKGLPLKGNKADLIKKLDNYDREGLWREEIKHIRTDDEAVAEGPGERASPTWREYVQEDVRPEEGAQSVARSNEDQPMPVMQGPGVDNTDGVYDIDQPRAHIERDPSFWRREQEFLRRELELTRRERDLAMQSSVTGRVDNNLWSNFRQPISAISELISEFSGAQDTFERWMKQFNLVRMTYSLDDNAARVIIGLK